MHCMCGGSEAGHHWRRGGEGEIELCAMIALRDLSHTGNLGGNECVECKWGTLVQLVTSWGGGVLALRALNAQSALEDLSQAGYYWGGGGDLSQSHHKGVGGCTRWTECTGASV